MKILYRISVFIAFVILCISPIPAAAQEKDLTILFTHDLHSYIETTIQGAEETGGFAKIKTLIDRIKVESPNTIVLDAGDFSMGTLYQSVFSEEAIELRLLGLMGYDAVTLGNHEFDYASDGLAKMLLTSKESGDPLPKILESNIDWENSTGEYTRILKDAMTAYGYKDYSVIEIGGVRAAIFGIMGEESARYAPTSGLTFLDATEAAKATIAKIKSNEDADIIIALSHSGTSTDKDRSEDEILAKNVPDIDVIISGHSHTILDQPIIIGNTMIASCGEYGKNFGKISLTKNTSGRWALTDYKLIPIDKSVPSDPEILKTIGKFKDLRQDYLDKFGFESYDQVLAESSFSFLDQPSMYTGEIEQPLGNLISDAYIYAVKEAEGENFIPVDVSVVPLGVIRSSFEKGEITVEDAYSTLSLGIGPDGLSGYPLVSVYLTGEELKSVAEIDASVVVLMSGVRLYWNGMFARINPNRMLLNRVVDTKMMTTNGDLEEINNDKLYRVITGMYSAKMLGAVESLSYGLLKLKPKDMEGNLIVDFDQSIIHDQSGREIKEWSALAEYLGSFEKENGVSVVPGRYSENEGRKILDNSGNIFDLIKNPNKISLIFGGVILLLIMLIFLIIRLVLKLIRRIRKAEYHSFWILK
jgi:2',3'-cyclic-nucleotide 2'-phosphodiesterase (5'-nucleotidase family)